jgi:hypothetical protein
MVTLTYSGTSLHDLLKVDIRMAGQVIHIFRQMERMIMITTIRLQRQVTY